MAVECRNSPLETVTPMTVASTRDHTPAVITATRPDAVDSGPIPFPEPALAASITANTAVSAAAVASRP